MSSKKNRRPAASRRPARRARRLGLLVAGALGVLCFALGHIPVSNAATIPTGPTPVDTVIRPDGSAAYVLDQGDSTVCVVDTATNQQTGMWPLGLPPGTVQDFDWHAGSQQLHIGCSNGSVLSLDPATGLVTTIIPTTGANYKVIVAENRNPGILGWGVDVNTGSLDQFLPGGIVTPVMPMFVGTEVELVAKRVDSQAPTPWDDFLLLVGTGGGGTTPTVGAYDRVSGAPPWYATWIGQPATTTGITTSTMGQAYVSATDPVTNDGLLLQYLLPTTSFAVPPISTFVGVPANDLDMAGPFVTVMLADPGGIRIRTFDAADPNNVLDAGGLLVDPTLFAGPSCATWGDAVGDLDGIYFLGVDGTQGATGQDYGGVRDIWVDPPLGTFGALTPYPVPTSSYEVLASEAIPCLDCPPREVDGRGSLDGADTGGGYPGTGSILSVQYSTAEEIRTIPLVRVPGVGMDLDLTLTYRSRRDFDYRYGQGWTLNQDVRLRTEPNGDKTYSNGYGRLDTYTFVPGGTYLPPIHYDTTLGVQGATTTITNRFGKVSTFSNATGQRTSLADRYGNAITYTWTGDRLTAITDTLGRTYTLNYGPSGRLSSIVDFGGRTWTFSYDYLGQLRSITTPATTQFPQGRTTWFSYSGNNTDVRFRSNLLRVWSPKGDVIQTLAYDGFDRVTGETIGDGTYAMSYAVPATNLVTTVTDPSGTTFAWTFDPSGMPLKKEVFTRGLRQNEPASYVTTYAINATTKLVDHVVLPRGNRIDYTYDNSLNLIEVRRKEADVPGHGATDIVQTWAYAGAFNQATQYTDPQGNTTVYTVDGSGNTTQIAYPTVTSPANQTITETFTFDPQGRILTATDGTNRSVAFAYYTAGPQTGYLQTVTRDPAGLALTTTFGYDQYGNVTSIQDPRSNTVSVTVDAENFVTEVQAPSPLNYRRRVTYDANRSVASVEVENIDRQGNQDGTTPWITTTYAYDVLGRLVQRTVPLTAATDAVTTYEYDGLGNLTLVVDAENGRTTYAWDERQLLWKATMGEGTAVEGTIEYTYNENGSLVTVKNPRGYETQSTYDLFDRRTQVTNALSHYTTFQYDASSNLTVVEAYDSQATLLARTTRYFDEVDRLWKTVRDRFGPGLTASYPQTVVTRDAAHRVTQVTDPLSNSTSYQYDGAGRLTQVLDAAGNHRDFTLDANGNVTTLSVTDIPAAGPSETFVTEFDYDVLNRRTERREIDRLNGQNILTTTFEYDSRSDLTFRTDAENHPVRWTYDLASRLVTYERALQIGQSIDDFTQAIQETFAYDAMGRLTALTDDNYNSTGYSYDARGQLTQTTYADTRYVTYGHDLNGNLHEWTDQNGTHVVNTHDALDRLTYRTVTRGTNVLGSTYEQFSYDGLDRTLTAVDDDYQVEMTWDSVGNLLKDRQGYNAQGQEQWMSVRTGYSDAGATTALTYPSGFQLTHGRDSIYRLTSLQDVAAATNIATFTWQGVGRLATTSNQNGTSTAYTWDGFARIQEIDHQLPTAQTFHKFEYAYDKVHNRRMEKNTFDAAWIATLPAQVQTFLERPERQGRRLRLRLGLPAGGRPLRRHEPAPGGPDPREPAVREERGLHAGRPGEPEPGPYHAAHAPVHGDLRRRRGEPVHGRGRRGADPRQQREPEGRRDLRLRLRLREPARPGPPVRHPDPDRRLPLRRARA